MNNKLLLLLLLFGYWFSLCIHHHRVISYFYSVLEKQNNHSSSYNLGGDMQSSRSSSTMRKIIQDLELRLGPSSSAPKGAAAAAGSILAATNCSRGGFPNLIMIQDDDDDDEDDDDVLMYDHTPSSSSAAMQLFPITSSWVPVITEEDLELRLGSRAHNGASGHNVEVKEEPSQTWKCVKAKYGFASNSRHCVKEVESVKLRCTICMDTMKEETSTMCGHVFCKSCIVNAIRVQNRCPTCRKEISINNIHRIYLPGATTS